MGHDPGKGERVVASDSVNPEGLSRYPMKPLRVPSAILGHLERVLEYRAIKSLPNGRRNRDS